MKIKKGIVITALGLFLFAFVPMFLAEYSADPCPARSVVSADQFPELSVWSRIGKAEATAQWSRKYDTACTTCHTSFPRLNYYGEKFMRNGFQDPDDLLDDGDTKGKKEYDRLFIGKLEDYFGARVSLQPLKVKTNGLNRQGQRETSFDIGEANWIQFFTAGTVAKNFSFFNELEIDDGGDVHHGWFIFGVHNVIGKRGLVNFQIGKISPVDWTSFSNRLRIFPEIKGFADKVNVSRSAASGVSEDATNISSGQWGINYYGYAGPFLWSAGIGNSAKVPDPNTHKNFWGTLRYDLTSGDSKFEGSSVSLVGYRGVDTSVTGAGAENTYWRIQPSFNIRWNNLIDFIASFHYAAENNVALTAASPDEQFWGITALLAFWLQEKYQFGVQYDTVRQEVLSNLTSVEDDRLAFHASYLVRDNINLILTADTDIPKRNGTKIHEFYTTVRMMW